jgi:uncharacterized protein (DUF1778 family)
MHHVHGEQYRAMAKTEFLQIRLTKEDRERLRRAAKADFLDLSTWARRVVLQALAEWEARKEGPVSKGGRR